MPEQQTPEQEILPELAELIRDTTAFEGTVTADTRFRDDLGMDSLTTIELIAAAEQVFGVQIPYEQLDDFVSVGELGGYLAKLRNE
ncbi:acyl carrier protein [Streptomyces sp. URMC 125]|uniref:acyl carrier protein n=1 Tax=Streptomyces sp. URMC 125 TaxID=3423419 RepID=UPI003F196139